MTRKAPEQIEKICNGCQINKPAKEFYRTNYGRLRSKCIECYAIHNRSQSKIHAEARKAYEQSRPCGWERSGRKKYIPPEPQRWAAYIKRKYGITGEQYENMLKDQGWLCAICRQECNRSSSTRMCIDHDHETGVVRGILCFQCNVGLGKFKDNVDLLNSAINYLSKQK